MRPFSLPRHRERPFGRVAIQSRKRQAVVREALDCFASLAMTEEKRRAL